MGRQTAGTKVLHPTGFDRGPLSERPVATHVQGDQAMRVLLITPENRFIKAFRRGQFNNFAQLTMPYLAGFVAGPTGSH